MKYFCLNIETAADRRAHCENEFAKAGIDVQFVNAFEAARNNVRYIHDGFRPGHLGCYISHLQLIQEICRYDHGPSMIFEDDVRLMDGFQEKLGTAMLTLPADWDMAVVGWWPAHWDYSRISSAPVNGHWIQISSGRIWGCYCYVVNGRKGADNVMQVLQPITDHLDEALYGAVKDGKITAYFLAEPLARWEEGFPSQTWGGKVPDLSMYK
jgi:GR25 family glycosyltransferase involved in LPS biosynthesis